MARTSWGRGAWRPRRRSGRRTRPGPPRSAVGRPRASARRGRRPRCPCGSFVSVGPGAADRIGRHDRRAHHPRRPQARRRAVRGRPLEDPDQPPRRAGRHGVDADGDVPPPGARAPGRRPGPRRAGRVLLDAGRLRGRAGQRWRDGVLGRRDVRADPREEPAPVVRRVLREVRLGRQGRAVARRPVGDRQRPGLAPRRGGRGRRRRLRLGAQRDLDRGDGAGRPPGRYDGRAGPGPGRRHLGCGRPAGRPQRGRHLLLRAAEVLRLRRRPLDRDHVARGHRAGGPDQGVAAGTSRRSSTSTSPSPSRGSTRPTTPRRSRRCS